MNLVKTVRMKDDEIRKLKQEWELERDKIIPQRKRTNASAEPVIQPNVKKPEEEIDPKLTLFLDKCVNNILFSRAVDFSDVTQLNQIFKSDAGRRRFTKVLKQTMKECESLILSENSFELMLYLFNTVLQNQRCF